MGTIVPDKVVLAREARGWTQGELARALGLSQGKVSKIESGLQGVAPEVLKRLAGAMSVPESLFEQTDPVYGAGPSEFHHRKRQSATSRLLKQLYANINLERMRIARLLRSVDLIWDVPTFSLDEFDSPATAARALRSTWRLPAGPIASVVATLEAHGVVIVERDVPSDKIDAVSHWSPGLPPLLYLNARLCRSRRRWTLCHELGHLVLHQVPSVDMEREADAFAAEFLMPGDEILPDLRDLSLHRLAQLKSVWHVSIAALLSRATQLSAVSRDDATRLWMRLSKLGLRKAEPGETELPYEEPRLLRAILDAHESDLGYTVEELAELLLCTREAFQTLYNRPSGRLRLVANARRA